MRASLTALGRCLLLISVLWATLLATGCGLKGDLYLPESQPPAADTEEAGAGEPESGQRDESSG